MKHETNNTRARSTRRRFLRTTGAVAAGLSVAGRSAAGARKEALALAGGPKAVTWPPNKCQAACKWPRYGPEEKKLVHQILDLDTAECYRELPLLEKDWKEYHQVPYVQSHCNGTSALTSMFFALDLPPGSEIMVPSYTFFSTVLAMRFFDYVPIFIDISPRTACFDLEYAARQLTKRTRALVPMHSWGLPCDMDQVCDFARKHDLIVLEDAAHAHGATLQGRLMGTWSEMSIFSFQATKPLPALEGGMGMYQTQEYYERAAVFGHYKIPPKLPKDSPYSRYVGTGLGLKFRIHPLAAALARQQLKGLDKRNADAAAQIRQLNDRILQLPGLSEPYCRPDAKRVYYSINMLFFDGAKAGFSRDALLKALKAEGVYARPGNYPLQHKYAVYSEAKWWHHKPKVPEVLPGSEQVNGTAVNLPRFTSQVPELVDQYAKAFEKVWAHRDQLAKL